MRRVAGKSLNGDSVFLFLFGTGCCCCVIRLRAVVLDFVYLCKVGTAVPPGTLTTAGTPATHVFSTSSSMTAQAPFVALEAAARESELMNVSALMLVLRSRYNNKILKT